MKFMLRLLLVFVLVIAAAYAATPLWLPGLIGKQLPDSWHLNQIKTGYPGISGISIHSLQLKGALPEAQLNISATDVRFSYRKFETHIDSMHVDVFLPASATVKPGISSIDDLAIPLIILPDAYQDLTIEQLNLVVHQPLDESAFDAAFEASFNQVILTPRPGEGFHLVSRFNYNGLPLGPGRLEVILSGDSLEADLQFPANNGVQNWLSINARQYGLRGAKSTEVRAEIDVDSITGDWLDSIISKSSDGRYSHASGQLSASATFSGPEAQHVQQVSLDTEKLRLVGDGETLDLSSGLGITRDRNNIIIELTEPVRIQALDNSRKLDQLLRNQFPQVRRSAHSKTVVTLELKAGSNFTIAAHDLFSIDYQGGAILDLENDVGTITLTSDSFSARMTEFPKLESVAIDGRFLIDWNEQATVIYNTGTTSATVSGLSVATEVISADGRLVSQGKAELNNGRIDDPKTTVDRINVEWQRLDLSTLTGTLAIQTHGLKSTSDGKTWSGFELNANASLTNGQSIKGLGKLSARQGPALPLEFSGTIDDNTWDISVPVTTIKPDQLDKLLKAAQFDLPANLVISDGHFDLAATVTVNKDMTASISINGHAIDVSFNKSQADNVRFSFNSQVGERISGSGPVSIETISLASGIDITRFESQLTLEHSDSFALRDLTANLFEGSLSLDELRYTENQLEETTVKLSSIDLAALLAFADIDGLTGSGSLDFKLPVRQNAEGLAITDGTFTSTGPGLLAYKSGDMSAGNIGLQALENFQYKQLTGVINYRPDGAYLLTVKLEGANPDLYDGYPVKFNLTINGALPALFESLFITGDFEGAILKEIKNR